MRFFGLPKCLSSLRIRAIRPRTDSPTTWDFAKAARALAAKSRLPGGISPTALASRRLAAAKERLRATRFSADLASLNKFSSPRVFSITDFEDLLEVPASSISKRAITNSYSAMPKRIERSTSRHQDGIPSLIADLSSRLTPP